MCTKFEKSPISVVENDMLFPIFFMKNSYYSVYRLNMTSFDYIFIGDFDTLEKAKERRILLMDEMNTYTFVIPKNF